MMDFHCNPCDRVFTSERALNQHLNDSPAHAQTVECNPCDRTFVSEDALNQHLRDSPLHQRLSDTPLNSFFCSFPTFDYDPSLAPSISYKRLQQHMCWQRGDDESDEAWNDYQDALKNELQKWYGSEDDLTAWHALCSAIGIDPLPVTCELCEKAARRTHVNIVDLIEWARSERVNKVRTFPNVEKLGAYTKSTGKVFGWRRRKCGPTASST
ncbi:Hypothetical protein R9X50_00169000 [Acrodontium crateriforme]|uniref:C2H2-type domain-containing protein n=1 Tax=Acrodontium crateriforme TaxID=150365 RepID=A0AAQ3R823_9PEZI|nr:Hypothetical protein R9X50_00169000 [Acrodontium crateriforme]